MGRVAARGSFPSVLASNKMAARQPRTRWPTGSDSDREQTSGHPGKAIIVNADAQRHLTSLALRGVAFAVLCAGYAVVPFLFAVALSSLIVALTSAGVELHQVVAGIVRLGGLILLSQVLLAVLGPMELGVTRSLDGAHRLRVANDLMDREVVAEIATPEVQLLARQASGDPSLGYDVTPGEAFCSLCRFLASALGCVVALVLIWRSDAVLVAVVAATAVACVAIGSYGNSVLAGKLSGAIAEEMHAGVWRRATLSPVEGKDVRVFGFADWMVRRMQAHVERGNGPFWRAFDTVQRWSVLSGLVSVAGLVTVFVYCILRLATGTWSLEQALTPMMLAWAVLLSLPANDDVYKIVTGQKAVRAARRLHQRVTHPVRVEEHREQRTPAAGRPPSVAFRGVRFAYPQSARPVLENVDLDVRAGELLAVVGVSGAGKSTLVKLLAGTHQPDAGEVRVDGVDLAGRGWTGRELSVTGQDFVRYPLSAVDNVTGAEAPAEVDWQRLREAAELAGICSFVEGLTLGWDTPLSAGRSGGVDLSGGQWQQIVLARGLYAVATGAKVLVLDEPTAHLDIRAELDTFRRVRALRGTATVIVISHRFSTVRDCDRIVVLDGGVVAERGTHAELMDRGGRYAEMFTTQGARLLKAGSDDVG